jgi:hypothetical protein
MENWKSKNQAATYLEGARSAIPFAGEQVNCFFKAFDLSIFGGIKQE